MGRWLCTAALAYVMWQAPVAQAASSGEPWSVQTSVRLRHFTTNWLAPPFFPGYDQPAIFAPDDRHFFFVSFHGDPSTDETVYELWVYETAAVRDAIRKGQRARLSGLAPLRKLTMRSRFPSVHSSAAIYLPRWLDSSTITFVGTEGRQTRRVFRYDIGSGALVPLTEPQYRLGESGGDEYVVRGSTTLFATYQRSPAVQKTHPFQLVDPELLYDLSGREGNGDLSADRWQMRVSRNGAPARVVAEGEADYRYGIFRSDPWISPDEKWAVMLYRPAGWRVPAEWSGYRFNAQAYWFVLINLESGVGQPLLAAPPGTARVLGSPPERRVRVFQRGRVFWSADSRHVLVLNAALPLEDRSPERQHSSYAIDFDVGTGQWRTVDVIATEAARVLAEPVWLNEGRALRVDYSRDKQPIGSRTYSFENGQWTARATDAAAEPVRKPRELTVSLRESPREPPQIIAALGKRAISLSGPDPALQNVRLTQPETLRWQDSDGKVVESDLLLPPDFARGKRAPLVIQFVGAPPDKFFPDGKPGTGDAAQTLAAQGFAVLRLLAAAGYGASGVRDASVFQTPQELPAQVKRVDDAVAMLRQRGIVDETPIGLIGFSRTGMYVYYVATHPGRTPIGAAVVFDSITNSYGQYINIAGTHGAEETKHYSLQFGNGRNFWANKEGWLDAPEFNLDRLRTPILFSGTGNPVITSVTETVGAFLLARRPFEFHSYPEAGHVLQSPRQREAAMQATVDWMNFWLRRLERNDADDHARLERWRGIRAAWEQVLKEESGAQDARVPGPAPESGGARE